MPRAHIDPALPIVDRAPNFSALSPHSEPRLNCAVGCAPEIATSHCKKHGELQLCYGSNGELQVKYGDSSPSPNSCVLLVEGVPPKWTVSQLHHHLKEIGLLLETCVVSEDVDGSGFRQGCLLARVPVDSQNMTDRQASKPRVRLKIALRAITTTPSGGGEDSGGRPSDHRETSRRRPEIPSNSAKESYGYSIAEPHEPCGISWQERRTPAGSKSHGRRQSRPRWFKRLCTRNSKREFADPVMGDALLLQESSAVQSADMRCSSSMRDDPRSNQNAMPAALDAVFSSTRKDSTLMTPSSDPQSPAYYMGCKTESRVSPTWQAIVGWTPPDQKPELCESKSLVQDPGASTYDSPSNCQPLNRASRTLIIDDLNALLLGDTASLVVAMSQFGAVKAADLVKKSGKRARAYVTFETPDMAQRALRRLRAYSSGSDGFSVHLA